MRRPIPADPPPNEVYNLAAVHRVPGHADREYFETNLSGAESVCAYSRRVGVKRLVFTGSISVYGPADEAKDEDSVPQPVTAYGQSKLEAESVHRAWAAESSRRPVRRR